MSTWDEIYLFLFLFLANGTKFWLQHFLHLELRMRMVLRLICTQLFTFLSLNFSLFL